MNIYLKFIFSLPKSIFFNFRHLPFRQAVKLPFYVRYGTKVNIKGKVKLEETSSLKMAMIVIGSHESNVSDPNHTTCLSVQKGGELIFQETAHIGLGTKIHVHKGARMYLGDNFAVSANSSFVCYKSMVMGQDIQFSWGCQVMDSDTHHIYDESGKEMNPDKEVRIGDKVWIGSNVVIMKGANIPDNCVVGACSFVSSGKFEPNTIILGAPAKSVKKIGGWRL